jgi:hypothetical protein
MRPAVLRVIFAALLVATPASQFHAFYAPKTDALSKLADILKDQGFSTSVLPVYLGYSRSMSVAVPGCDWPLRVTPIRLSLEEVPLLEGSLIPGDVSHYVFVGRSWSAPTPRSIRLEWLKHKLAPLLGFPIRARLDTVLFVAAPRSCTAAEKIDWLPLWSS